MNTERITWRIQDLTRLDLLITRILIGFGFSVAYCTLVVLAIVFGSANTADWWWWAVLLLTGIFFVLGLLIIQRIVRYEQHMLSSLPQSAPMSEASPSIDLATPQQTELESPRYEEPMVMIQSEVSYPSSAWEPKG